MKYPLGTLIRSEGAITPTSEFLIVGFIEEEEDPREEPKYEMAFIKGGKVTMVKSVPVSEVNGKVKRNKFLELVSEGVDKLEYPFDELYEQMNS